MVCTVMKNTHTPLLISMTAFRRPLLALLLLPVLGSASAATLQLDIDTVFSGPGVPEGTTPWIAVTLDDSVGGANTVRLTMETVGLVDTEFASEIYLNFNPNLDPTALSFAQVVNPTGLGLSDIDTGINLFKADGDGFFDIFFNFPTSGSTFTKEKVVVFDLTYTSAITADSFKYKSVEGGGNGSYFAAAHIQSIGEDSSWIGAPDAVSEGPGIPEPSSTALLGLGALALMLRRRR